MTPIFSSISVFHESVEHLSRQCDDFHWVCFAFGPLFAFEASLWQGRGSWRHWRCCRADGEREKVCKWMFTGGEGRKRGAALPQGFVLPLRLLASPVKATGCERVVSAEVSPAVGHTQTVSGLSGEGHLHRNRALERHCTGPRLQTRGQTRVGREATRRGHRRIPG